MHWNDRPSSFRERKAPVNAVHSENGKLEHDQSLTDLRLISQTWKEMNERLMVNVGWLRISASRSQLSPLSSQNWPRSWFPRKMSPLNWNELFQLTPELSLQISVLALLSSQNWPRSWFPRKMSLTQLKWTVSAYSRTQPSDLILGPSELSELGHVLISNTSPQGSKG